MTTDDTASPRDRRRQAVADGIVAAARSILLERTTADALSMREVARRADYTVGALYRYFPNREALLVELFTDAGRRLTSYFVPARELPVLERLSAFGEAYLAFGREHPEDLLLIFQSRSHVPTWTEYAKIAVPFTWAVEAVAEGVQSGVLRLPPGLDAADTAYALWTLLHGMTELQRAHLRDVRRDVQPVQRAILANFIASITAPTPQHSEEPS